MNELEKREKTLEQKFWNFLYNKWHIILIAILILAAYFRFKNMNINTALWWDEADYLSLAKHYGLGTPIDTAPWRARGMAFIWAIFYWLGANETIIRILIQLVSLGGVYMCYLLGKDLVNKKVGLVAAFMMSVFWVHLFWSARIEMAMHGMLVWTVSAWLFWKGYVKNGKSWWLALAAGLAAYGMFMYSAVGFIAIFFLLYLLFADKFKFIKSKKMWLAFGVAILIIGTMFAYNYVNFGSVNPRIERTITAETTLDETDQPWNRPFGELFNDFITYTIHFQDYLLWPFFILFLIGLGTFFDLFLGFDLLLKGQEPRLKKKWFLFTWVLTVLIIFSFILTFTHFYYEPRFLFPMFPAVFVIAGIGAVKLYEIIAKHNKHIALVLVLSILAIGGYNQINESDNLINAHQDSFAGERYVGEWLYENTEEGDVIITCNQNVPFIYYTSRLVLGFGTNMTKADELIETYDSKYVIIDAYNHDCAFTYGEERDNLVPVYGYFYDEVQTIPLVLVYEVQK